MLARFRRTRRARLQATVAAQVVEQPVVRLLLGLLEGLLLAGLARLGGLAADARPVARRLNPRLEPPGLKLLQPLEPPQTGLEFLGGPDGDCLV